jgi:hypothetical protein
LDLSDQAPLLNEGLDVCQSSVFVQIAYEHDFLFRNEIITELLYPLATFMIIKFVVLSQLLLHQSLA